MCFVLVFLLFLGNIFNILNVVYYGFVKGIYVKVVKWF